MLYEQFLVMGWQSHKMGWMVEMVRRRVFEEGLFMTTEKWPTPGRQSPPAAGHIPAILRLFCSFPVKRDPRPPVWAGEMPIASKASRVLAALPLP